MSKPFHVSVLGLKKIHDMPKTWAEEDYRALLTRLEVDDIDEIESRDLLEFVLMALQDLDPEDAGDQVLAYKLGSDVSAGSRQNIVQDLLEGQRPWEELSDIRLHARVFAASLLLYQARPRLFPKPDMLQLMLQLKARNAEAKALLATPPEAAFVTRVLADGMDEHSILERLFDEQLAARSFPEANGVIWLAEFGEPDDDGSSATLTVYSSQHWLHDLENVDQFESGAYNDCPDDEDED